MLNSEHLEDIYINSTYGMMNLEALLVQNIHSKIKYQLSGLRIFQKMNCLEQNALEKYIRNPLQAQNPEVDVSQIDNSIVLNIAKKITTKIKAHASSLSKCYFTSIGIFVLCFLLRMIFTQYEIANYERSKDTYLTRNDNYSSSNPSNL